MKNSVFNICLKSVSETAASRSIAGKVLGVNHDELFLDMFRYYLNISFIIGTS